MNTPKDETVTTTIKEAQGFPVKTPLQRIVGKVALVWDRTAGEGKWGPWTKQSGLLEDGNGNSMVFTVWDKPDFSEYKGRSVVFRTGTGSKPTLTLTADYKDASKRSLNVSKSCFFLTEEEESDDIPMDYPDKRDPDIEIEPNTGEPFTVKKQPQANVATKKPCLDEALNKAFPSSSNSKPEDPIDYVQKRVIQLANLRKICDETSEIIYQKSFKSAELVKDVSSCFFIQCVRDGLHLKLPNDRIIVSKNEEAGASENLEEKEDEIF